MDFALLPPEVNSGRMYAGAGAGPLLAAASSWDALGTELHTAGLAYESVLTELSSGWAGPSAAAMATAATPYAQWMRTAAVQAEETAIQARAATAAYETAFAMTVPPAVVAANRSLLMTLVATNFLGQNTPAIAATEAHYAQMWAQDATAMYGYASSAAAATRLTPFTPPPRTTNPAGAAAQAGAVGQAATGGAATGASAHAGVIGPAAAAVGAPVAELSNAGLELVVDSIGTFGIDALGSFLIDPLGLAEIGEGLLLTPIAMTPVTASLASATSISGLSVPLAWTAAVPSAIPQVSLASTGRAVAGAVAAGETAVPAVGMAAAGLAGRASAGAGRGRRGAAAGQKAGTATGRPPSGRADELPELAAASAFGLLMGADTELRELAELRDAGILTAEEYAAEKQSLVGR